MVVYVLALCLFFFKQKTAYEMRISDWSSDVCSSDLCKAEVREPGGSLRAGTYAQVRIVTGNEKSIAVPERAVLHTEKGFTVFVVEGKTARARPSSDERRVGKGCVSQCRSRW